MPWKPSLSITCQRCGRPREGIRHDCRSNSTRKATATPKVSFGKCPKCDRPYGGNPAAHVCKPKSDFKQRKSAAAKAEKAKARKRRQAEKHDFQACSDKACPRPLCVAYRAGWRDGFPAGQAACPLPHQG